MQTPLPNLFSVALLASVIVSTATAAESSLEANAAMRINSANALVRAGKFDAALEGYRQVLPTDETHDELNYNLAVTQYRKGDIESAKSLFTAAAASADAPLAAASRYNLGNCFYADAVKVADQEQPAAIESLRAAILHYRGSLQGDPSRVDARANIELAGELLKKLKEEQEQEQQDQQDQQQQDAQNGDSESEENESQQDRQQQDQDSESTGNDAHQDEQQGQDAEFDPKQQHDHQQDTHSPGAASQEHEPRPDQQQSNQESASQAHESPQDEQQQGGNVEPTPGEQGSDSQTSADDRSQPSKTEEQMSKDGRPKTDTHAAEQAANQQASPAQDRQPQQAGESATEQAADATDQRVPTGELTASGDPDANEKPNGRVAMAAPNANDGLMTKEEALKMLQSVRDRDMLRRLRQERIERSRHVPVDRDW